MSEKVARCDVQQLRDNPYMLEEEYGFDAGDAVVVIPAEEYDRLMAQVGVASDLLEALQAHEVYTNHVKTCEKCKTEAHECQEARHLWGISGHLRRDAIAKAISPAPEESRKARRPLTPVEAAILRGVLQNLATQSMVEYTTERIYGYHLRDIRPAWERLVAEHIITCDDRGFHSTAWTTAEIDQAVKEG